MEGCTICQDKEASRMLLLPCDENHLICTICLNKNRIANGLVTKCRLCSKSFAWLDESLLEVYGGEEEVNVAQSCTTAACSTSGSRAVQSGHFCITERLNLCCRCHKMHERLHRRRENKHEVITFNELRASPNKYHQYICDRNGHDNFEISFACTKCSTLGCVRCRYEPADCDDGGSHYMESVVGQAEDVIKRIEELKSSAHVEELNLKGIRENDAASIETTSVMVESLVSRNTAQIKEARAKLEELRKVNENLLETYRGEQAERYNEDKKMKQEKDNNLRGIIDHITALLKSSHPVKLIQVEREVRDQLEREIEESRCQPFIVSDPELKVVDVTAENLIGLEVIIPAVLLPRGIKFLKTVYTEYSCQTVAFQGGELVHGGNEYISRIGLNTAGSTVCCIRVYGKSVVVLQRNVRKREAHVIELMKNWQQRWKARDEIFSQVKRFQVNIDDGQISKVSNNFIVKTNASQRYLSIYTSDTARVKKIYHPDFNYPLGVCSLEEDVYIADRDACTVFIFKILQPQQIRKLDVRISQPVAITTYNGDLVVLSGDAKLHIVTLLGEPVTVIDLPECVECLKYGVHDISMNENGTIAVAHGTAGVKLYKFTFN